MAFKTFVDGVVLPASDLNTYLMKQAVIVCTSGTRPSSPVEGMTIYETDTDLVYTYDGTTWRPIASNAAATSFTPQIDQGGTTNIGKTVNYSKYKLLSGICHWWFYLSVTGSGTSGFAITLTVPVPFVFGGVGVPIGDAAIFDSSAGSGGVFQGIWKPSGSVIVMTTAGSTTSIGAGFALASGDEIQGVVSYPTI